MNHQNIYSGKCHCHSSSIQESSSQKAGSSKSWQAFGDGWTCSNFPWQLRREDPYPLISLEHLQPLQHFKGKCDNHNTLNDSATPATL